LDQADAEPDDAPGEEDNTDLTLVAARQFNVRAIFRATRATSI
jgi:hypothetical protein